MNKYVLSIFTLGLVSLQAMSSASSEPTVTTTGGMDPSGYAKLQKKTQMALNPYQKSNGGQTFYVKAAYAGGIVGPHAVIAANGINFDASTDGRNPHSLLVTPLNWSNGFNLSFGLVKSGNSNSGFVSEFVYFTNSNSKKEVILDIDAVKMSPNFPNDTAHGDTLPVFRASGQYDLPTYLAYKVLYLGNYLEVASLSVLLESGIAGTYTKHTLATQYSIQNGPAVDEDEDLEQVIVATTCEKIASIGPWAGVHVRKSLRFGFFLEALLGATGQLTYIDNHASDAVTNEPTGRFSTYDVSSKSVLALSHAIEASLGLGVTFEYDTLELEAAMSWCTTSRPNYTMVAAPAYSTGAGALSALNANFMKAGLAVKF